MDAVGMDAEVMVVVEAGVAVGVAKSICFYWGNYPNFHNFF